jgi:hypothetical protein
MHTRPAKTQRSKPVNDHHITGTIGSVPRTG